jgi:hypothetical protein
MGAGLLNNKATKEQSFAALLLGYLVVKTLTVLRVRFFFFLLPFALSIPRHVARLRARTVSFRSPSAD